MDREEAEAFTSGLGQVFGGGWQLILSAQRMGIPQALGMSTDAWVHERLGGYVRLSIEDRRQAVAELTEAGLSSRQAADVLGVGRSTVARDQQAGPFGPDADGGPGEMWATHDPNGSDAPPDYTDEEAQQVLPKHVGCVRRRANPEWVAEPSQ